MTIFYSWKVSIEKAINRSCLKTAWSWPQAVTCAVYLESCSAAFTQVFLLFYCQCCVKNILLVDLMLALFLACVYSRYII